MEEGKKESLAREGGGGGGGGGGAVKATLEVTFQSIAETLMQMQNTMQDMKLKSERTDELVRAVLQTVDGQEQIVQRLQKRLTAVEPRLKQAGRRRKDSSFCPEAASLHNFPPVVSSIPNVSPAAAAVPAAAAPAFPAVQSTPSVVFAARAPVSSVALAMARCPAAPAAPPSAHGGERAAHHNALGAALLKAVEDGSMAEVQGVIDTGADTNYCTAGGWTPLHRAARKSLANIISLLLNSGANVNARTCYGFTPLHLAAYHDPSGQCVSMLIDAGSNLGSRNETGRTPLHSAAESGNMAAVRELLAAGASSSAKNNVGKTPFDIAKTSAVRKLLATGM